MYDFKTLYPLVKYDPEMVVNPVEWLIDGIWQRGKINGMSGFEKAGKSRFVNWLLAGMFNGSVLGLTATPQRVLYLCGEEKIDHVNSRITRYADAQGVDKSKICINFVEAAAMRLDLKSQRDALLDMIIESASEMLVIDPWRRVHGADENDSSSMAPLYNDIRRWSNSFGLTVLILHHTPKLGEDTDMSRIASWFRGSTDLPAILDTAQYVDRESRRKMNIVRQGRFPPLPVLSVEDLGGSALNHDRGFQIA